MKKAMPAMALLAALLSPPLAAQDAVPGAAAPGGGEQDLPKVLYIVPWKDAEIGAPLPPPQVGLDEAVLAPVSRDGFRQRLRYQTGTGAAAASGP